LTFEVIQTANYRDKWKSESTLKNKTKDNDALSYCVNIGYNHIISRISVLIQYLQAGGRI